jgi:GDPmannose 4,6-dehydratase
LQQNPMRDFIICSGQSISLREITEHIFHQLKIPMDKMKIETQLYRPTDISDIYGDNSLAKKILNWDYSMKFLDVVDLLIEEECNNQ